MSPKTPIKQIGSDALPVQLHTAKHPDIHFLCLKSITQEGIVTSYKGVPFASTQRNNSEASYASTQLAGKCSCCRNVIDTRDITDPTLPTEG